MVIFEVFWGLEREFGQSGQGFASQPQAGWRAANAVSLLRLFAV